MAESVLDKTPGNGCCCGKQDICTPTEDMDLKKMKNQVSHYSEQPIRPTETLALREEQQMERKEKEKSENKRQKETKVLDCSLH